VMDPAIDAVDNQVDPLAQLVPGKALARPGPQSSPRSPRHEGRIGQCRAPRRTERTWVYQTSTDRQVRP
jgi:hypothetical protein